MYLDIRMRRARGTMEIPGIVVSKTQMENCRFGTAALEISSRIEEGVVFVRENVHVISSVGSHGAVRCSFCSPVLGWQVLVSDVFPVAPLHLFVRFSVPALVVGAES